MTSGFRICGLGFLTLTPVQYGDMRVETGLDLETFTEVTAADGSSCHGSYTFIKPGSNKSKDGWWNVERM